ncbi:MAG: hypothetical protein WCK67_07225 [bacterium]
MIGNLASLVNSVFQQPQIKPAVNISAPITTSSSNNPFASPFLNNTPARDNAYGKNMPFLGGFYAGDYNGKPNIVGSRLFIEV